MTRPQPPQLDQDDQDRTRVRLSGSWVLATALPSAELLESVSGSVHRIDASGIQQLDSAGVLQLLRFASRAGLKDDAIEFREEHQALVCTIEELNDERPKRKRDYGFAAALERLGLAVSTTGKDIVALASFLGENLVKLGRLLHAPRRFRTTSAVYHMEQVGLDAVPLVVLLSYLVGAVIAFLGSTILRDFGAEIYVVELVSIATLRELAVLMTAIVVAGRTASAFTAQIGAMKAREEIDAIQTLGLDPIDLLVLPRVVALVVMLPLLTFIDTPGAYPGIGAEERGQSEAIARNLLEMAELKVPVICTVIGEGGSGGALAIGVGDRTLMLEYGTYSVISPEGCASILWKDAGKAKDAAEQLGLTAKRLKGLGLVDKVVREPIGGAHRNPGQMARRLKAVLLNELDALEPLPVDVLLQKRYERLRSYGAYEAA
ncbi:ABC transporter permease [Xanthomonas sp. Kuri4-3]